MTHKNSSESLKRVDRETRWNAILDALYLEGAMTARQLKNYLRLQDMNEVAPRITELIEQGRIREAGNVKCGYTGRPVRTVTLNDGRLF